MEVICESPVYEGDIIWESLVGWVSCIAKRCDKEVSTGGNKLEAVVVGRVGRDTVFGFLRQFLIHVVITGRLFFF